MHNIKPFFFSESVFTMNEKQCAVLCSRNSNPLVAPDPSSAGEKLAVVSHDLLNISDSVMLTYVARRVQASPPTAQECALQAERHTGGGKVE